MLLSLYILVVYFSFKKFVEDYYPFFCKTKQTSPGYGRRKKKSSLPSEDSAKLRNLKRYTRTCGMHFKYVDIFADCKSMSQKERKLDKLIRVRTGFEGDAFQRLCYGTINPLLNPLSLISHPPPPFFFFWGRKLISPLLF